MRLLGLYLLGCLVLLGCSQSVDNREPPAALRAFPETVRIQQVWSRSLATTPTTQTVRLQPYLDGGLIYAAASNGHLAAYQAKDGARSWSVDLQLPLSAGVGGDAEQLYLATGNGEVLALDRRNGEIRWRTALSSEVLVTPGSDRGKLIVRSVDGRVVALSAATGERLWTYSSDVPALSLRGQSKPLLVGGAALLGLDNGRFIALRLEDGRVLWQQTIAIPKGRSEVERLVDVDGDALLSGRQLFVASYQGRVVRLEPQDGSVRWAKDMSVRQGLSADAKHVFVSDAESVLSALDPDEGAVLWKQDALRMRRLTTPVVYDSYVVSADFEAYLHVFAAEDGRLLGRRKVAEDAILVAPIRADGLLYVQTQGGKLAAFRLEAIATQ